MSSAPSNQDPEKYSLEEMMERLKGRPSQTPGEGELVTRTDGTQAVRVRKRKRRSDQPKRQEFKRRRRIRAIQVGSILGSLLLLILVIGGAFIYTNTAPYRKRLSDAFSRTLGADIEFKGFRVTPVSANADSVTLNWPAGGFLKSVRLSHITSKISPRTLFGRSITGEAIFAREGEIQLQTPAGSAAADAQAAPGTQPVSFNRAAVTKLGITFGDPLNPALRIVGSEGTLSTSETKLSKTVNLHRGILTLRDWPALKLERALLEIAEDGTEVVSLRIGDSMTPRGEMDISGSINTRSPNTRSKLAVKLETFTLGDLLGADLGGLLNLRVDTQGPEGANLISFTAAAPDDAELKLTFTNSLSSSNNISGFRFLSLIARALDDSYYDNPEFDEASGTIHRQGQQIDITDLHLERKTLLCVKGNLSVAPDRTLSGTFKVGIPESVIHLSLNSKLDAMSSPASSGFRWIPVTIGGLLTRPSDDFGQNYQQTAPAPRPTTPDSLEDPPPSAGDPPAPQPGSPADPGKAFNDLTNPR
jgi:hypothetical protein